MSDCTNGGRRVYNVPTHSPDEDRLETVLHFVGDSFPRVFVINRLGREVDYVTVDGERYERVSECEMEPSFIEPSRLDFMQEYLCSECGEYSYMQIACDGDGVNYCSTCGAKAVNRI